MEENNMLIKTFTASLNKKVGISNDNCFDYSNLFSNNLDCNLKDIIKDSLIENLPVVKEIATAADTANQINNWNLLNQTATFFQEYYKGGELSPKAKDHLNDILSNPEKLDEEIIRVLILLNNNKDRIKSKYDAKYLRALLDYEISREDYLELLDITDRMFVTDFETLRAAYNSPGIQDKDLTYKHDRLVSLGILRGPYDHRGAILRAKDSPVLLVTHIGEQMCKVIFKE